MMDVSQKCCAKRERGQFWFYSVCNSDEKNDEARKKLATARCGAALHTAQKESTPPGVDKEDHTRILSQRDERDTEREGENTRGHGAKKDTTTYSLKPLNPKP
jgi:hypothetical protein